MTSAECLSAKFFFSSKMDQIRKFGEQTSRILEFKPEGLEPNKLEQFEFKLEKNIRI